MPLPTVSDVQAVDPVLTNLLVGYAQAESRFVASRVFPVVPVEKDSGTYYIWTKKYWFLDEMKQRAPGQQYARVGFGASNATYTTLQWALSHAIPDEVRANSQVPGDMEAAATRFLGQQSLIRKERAFAADFMTTGVWGTDDNNSTTDWDDFSGGDPRTDIRTAKRTISSATGSMANTAVIGEIVEDALMLHPDILDAIKYTQAATADNVAGMLAAALGLEQVLVARASYNSANEGASGTYTAIIDDDALICYVSPSPGLFDASAGYTFAWGGGGGAGVIMRNRDDLNDTDVVKIKEQWDQKAVATDVGYFFADVV